MRKVKRLLGGAAVIILSFWHPSASANTYFDHCFSESITVIGPNASYYETGSGWKPLGKAVPATKIIIPPYSKKGKTYKIHGIIVNSSFFIPSELHDEVCGKP